MTPNPISEPFVAARDWPIQVHIEYLKNVSRVDATEYALGYLRAHSQTHRTWYGVFEYGEGFIVELHQGGQGRAYMPTILAELERNPTRDFAQHPLRASVSFGRHRLYIRVTPDAVSSMALAEGVVFDTDMEAAPSQDRLTKADFRHSARLRRASLALLGVSTVVCLVAFLNQPDGARITIDPVKPHDTALYHWQNSLNWSASERPQTVRLHEGRWTVETNVSR